MLQVLNASPRQPLTKNDFKSWGKRVVNQGPCVIIAFILQLHLKVVLQYIISWNFPFGICCHCEAVEVKVNPITCSISVFSVRYSHAKTINRIVTANSGFTFLMYNLHVKIILNYHKTIMTLFFFAYIFRHASNWMTMDSV